MAFKRSAVRSRLSPPKTRESEERALKSDDFKALSFPKARNSGDLQKAPVCLIFDDDTDDLTYAYAPDPTKAPEYEMQPVYAGKSVC